MRMLLKSRRDGGAVRRDGGAVFCVEKSAWVDIESCYRCPALRKVRAGSVACATSTECIYGAEVQRLLLEAAGR
jgi:hypothetical protein